MIITMPLSRNLSEGTNPEHRRKVINTETGDVANTRGGVNIIGNLQPSSRIVVLPCTFPTKLEIQNGEIRYTSSGSPFVASMSDRANATAMLVRSFISMMQTFYPDLVFLVFDVCSTVPNDGHNQADPDNQLWNQFSPHAKEFLVKLIAANCPTFLFISPQAYHKIGAGNIGTVISTMRLSDKGNLQKVAVDNKVVTFGQSPIYIGQAAYCAASLVLKHAYLDRILTVFMATQSQEANCIAQHGRQGVQHGIMGCGNAPHDGIRTQERVRK